MKSNTQPAQRLKDFNKPTIWTIMTPLAEQTKSINLGQGFPTWQPPAFFKKNYKKSIPDSNHQYCRAYGSVQYVKAIAEFHKSTFGQIDPINEICVVNGGVEGLYSSILGLVNPGEEVIIFDPSYDFYRPHVQLAGGKSIGVPLIPRKNQSKEDLIKKTATKIVSDQNDEWDLDFELFQKSLNEKTKAVIVNSPHNPIGKVFTNEQLAKMAQILQKFPQVVVIEDNVYTGMTFDDMLGKPLPKIAFQKGMRERTLSVYSAGKIFSATGVRSGWIVGPKQLINSARTVHQYTVFCQYNVTESAIALSLEEINKPGNTYLMDAATRLVKHRDLLIRELLQSSLDINLWIPKGGYFVLADISRVPILEKYLTDEHGNKRSRDLAFAYQLAYENRVVCIPMSPFYGPEDSKLGERYVRFAFCKDQEMLLELSKRLKK